MTTPRHKSVQFRIDSAVGDIDRLIDSQLNDGEPQVSWVDPQFPKCPWCCGEWHGLPITEWMWFMRTLGHMPVNYKYAEDTSRWVCPGSDYHGPARAEGGWGKPDYVSTRRSFHRQDADYLPAGGWTYPFWLCLYDSLCGLHITI